MADTTHPDPEDCFHCPKATSRAPLPTSPGHGWRHRPSRPLQSRTAPIVLGRHPSQAPG
jgi:hypothetical protein